MTVCIHPAHLYGRVTPPPSKSLLHRVLICRAQAAQPLPDGPWPDDVQRTLHGLRLLQTEAAPCVDCGASGSTLRFLLPLAMAWGRTGAVFTGTKRLLHRPVPGDWGLRRTARGLTVTRPLTGGDYRLAGDVTSQLLSGLLMALPRCARDSRLLLTTPLRSRPYIDLTLQTLRRFGVAAAPIRNGWRIPGGQNFAPAPWEVEADWSAAAFWLVLRALGQAVEADGLRPDSLQGDRAVAVLCRERPETVDLGDIPDLFPPLALLAALTPGQTTRFTGLARLRMKESDRPAAVCRVLTDLGAVAHEEYDSVAVTGRSQLAGGRTDSFGDHRIAMLAACAAPFCRESVVLTDASCVTKSYPAFWTDYQTLHGQVEVLVP